MAGPDTLTMKYLSAMSILFLALVGCAGATTVTAQDSTTAMSGITVPEIAGADFLAQSNQDSEDSGGSSVVAIGAGVGGAVALIAVIALFVAKRRYDFNQTKNTIRLEVEKTLAGASELQWDHSDGETNKSPKHSGWKNSEGSSATDDYGPGTIKDDEALSHPFMTDGVVRGVRWEANGDVCVGGQLITTAANKNVDVSSKMKIDHLRSWNSAAGLSPEIANLHDGPTSLEPELVTLCHLCDQLGTCSSAVKSCITCGDLTMCATCFDSTHGPKNKKNKKHKIVPIISRACDSPAVGSETVIDDDGSASTSSAPQSRLSNLSFSDAQNLDRLPFASEIPSIRKHLINHRGQKNTSTAEVPSYEFFKRASHEMSKSTSTIYLRTPNEYDQKPRRASTSVLNKMPRKSNTNISDTVSTVDSIQEVDEFDRLQASEALQRTKKFPTRRDLVDARKQAANAERQSQRRASKQAAEEAVSKVEAISINIDEIHVEEEDEPVNTAETQEKMLECEESIQNDERCFTFGGDGSDEVVSWLVDELLSLTVNLGESENKDIREGIRNQYWRLALLESRKKHAIKMALESNKKVLSRFSTMSSELKDSPRNSICFGSENGTEVTLEDLIIQEEEERNQRKASIQRMLATVGRATMTTPQLPKIATLPEVGEVEDKYNGEVDVDSGDVIKRRSGSGSVIEVSPMHRHSFSRSDTLTKQRRSSALSPLPVPEENIPVPDLQGFTSVLAELGAALKSRQSKNLHSTNERRPIP